MPRILLRPTDRRYKLTVEEQNCLTWHALSGCSREEAYRIFVRPDLAISKINLRTIATQFFSSMEARAYLSSYENYLNSNGQETESTEQEPIEKRTASAKLKFTDKVLSKMMGEVETIDEMDAIAKLADRVGVLDEKEEGSEAPRRYLPERCCECSYKSFVEGCIDGGDVLNECASCRTRKFAEEHGWHFDATRNIEPQ